MKKVILLLLFFMSQAGWTQTTMTILGTSGRKYLIGKNLSIENQRITGPLMKDTLLPGTNLPAVGMRSTNPLALFEINGTNYPSEKTFQIRGVGNIAPTLNTVSDANFAGIRLDRNLTQRWFMGMAAIQGTEHPFTIQGNGNIGIGTDSPQSKLHVIGKILATDSIVVGVGLKTPTGTANQYLMANGTLRSKPNILFVDTLFSGGLQGLSLGNRTPSAFFTIDGTNYNAKNIFKLTSNSSVSIAINTQLDAAGVKFEKNNNNIWNVGMEIPGNDHLVFRSLATNTFGYLQLNADNGRLGIGTKNPTAFLDVKHDTRVPSGTNDFVRFSNANQAVVRINSNNIKYRAGISFERKNVAKFTIEMDSLTNNYLIKTSTSTRDSLKGLALRSDNGNVGIGTTVPVTNLDVNGALAANGFLYNYKELNNSPYVFNSEDDFLFSYSNPEYFLPSPSSNLAGKRIIIINNSEIKIFPTTLGKILNGTTIDSINSATGKVFLRKFIILYTSNGTDWFTEPFQGTAGNIPTL